MSPRDDLDPAPDFFDGPLSGEDFAEAVLDLVAQIPSGRVMSYGDIASALGSLAARRVGNVMARGGGNVPWWRVIRASGEPPVGHAAPALEHYKLEGTPVRYTDSGYRVVMSRARWRPPR